MIKLQKSSIVILSAVFLAAFLFYIGYKKVESLKKQNESSTVEMQNKLAEQQAKIDEQQSKMEELQGFKTEQEQSNADADTNAWQNKKADCDARLKKQQDSLASAQRSLGEYRTVVSYVKADNCPKEKTRLCDTVCYDDCLKQNDCTKSSCDDDVKKECKKSHEDNLANITKEMNDEAESVKNSEAKLQSIKNECVQYFN